MADVNSAPQNGPVLAYTNVTNERGWNDPPSFVFSPNTTGNRKRIDPRKRAAHNIISMNNGYAASPVPAQTFQPIQQTPAPQPFQPIQQLPAPQPFQPVQQSPAPQSMMNNSGTASPYSNVYNAPVMNGFQNMTMTPPQQPPLHHASSNPDLHQMNSMQPLQMQLPHSASVPAHMNNSGQNRIPGHSLGYMTPPPSSCNTPPLVQTRSGSATPPHIYMHNQVNNSRKMSAPSMAFAIPSIFSQHSTPTMLQSSHLKPNANGTLSTTQNGIITNQPTSLPAPVSPVPQVMPEYLQNNGYNRSNSTPEAFRRPSPTNNIPPPTMGYYTHRASSGGSSPKNSSPGHSGKSSPTPSLDPTLLDNDNDALTNTLNLLNNFKCSCQLTNKLSDDIGKKIQNFEAAWKSGKLSANAKNKMLLLAQALNGKDIRLADKLHKSLIHDHANEVTSWIIGIKKLITTYQSIPGYQ